MTPSDWERAISVQTCRAERAVADLTEMRRVAANATLRADVAEERLALALETNKELNRRCGTYESAIAEKVSAASGRSVGRALANGAAAMYRAEVERLRAAMHIIRQWDMLTPRTDGWPTESLSDGPWLRGVLDDALGTTSVSPAKSK